MRQSASVQLWIHLFIWLVIFTLPVWTINARGIHIDSSFMLHSAILPLGFMLCFYANYLFFIEKLLFKQKTLSFLLINILIITVLVYLTITAKFLFEPPHFLRELPNSPRSFPSAFPMRMKPPHAGPHPRDGMPYLFHAMLLTSVVGVAVAIRMTGKWYRDQTRMQQLEKEKSEAELSQLKSQLNPHFLFNSLNNIYALVEFDQQKAQRAISSLSDMLRYQLYDAEKERIPLQKELEFVRSYCGLMQLRIPKTCRVNLQIDEPSRELFVAPLMFITLVENAFKHGLSPTEPSFVDIQIRVQEDHSIVCSVRNSAFPKDQSDRSGSGIGLENLKKRLNLIYPDQYSFFTENKDGIYTAQIILFNTENHANSMLHR